VLFEFLEPSSIGGQFFSCRGAAGDETGVAAARAKSSGTVGRRRALKPRKRGRLTRSTQARASIHGKEGKRISHGSKTATAVRRKFFIRSGPGHLEINSARSFQDHFIASHGTLVLSVSGKRHRVLWPARVLVSHLNIQGRGRTINFRTDLLGQILICSLTRSATGLCGCLQCRRLYR